MCGDNVYIIKDSNKNIVKVLSSHNEAEDFIKYKGDDYNDQLYIEALKISSYRPFNKRYKVSQQFSVGKEFIDFYPRIQLTDNQCTDSNIVEYIAVADFYDFISIKFRIIRYFDEYKFDEKAVLENVYQIGVKICKDIIQLGKENKDVKYIRDYIRKAYLDKIEIKKEM